jgi:glycosyltransferase involved in cell wall biosynthesis
MRILIVEEALHTGEGHWPSYIGDLATGFREAGDEVDVLTHREATPEVLRRVGGTPWLSRSFWDEDKNRSRGVLGGITHNINLYRELKNYLRDRPPYDYVLALTMRAYHILAFGALARSSLLGRNTRLLLLFVHPQGVFVAPGVPARIPRNFRTAIMHVGFRLLSRSVREGKTILAVETEGMKEEYERFSGLPFRFFPHAIRFGSDSPIRSRVPAAGEEKREITFTCPGFARFEKGIDLLQTAVIEIFREEPEFPARFVVQWQNPFSMPDGSLLKPLPKFLNNPKVEILDRTIGPVEYEELLARSDALLLPYRAAFYYARVSRVAIETICRGIPLVYPAATWLEEACANYGAGVSFQDENLESLKEAIRSTVQNYRDIGQKAGTRSKAALEFFSVPTFRANMLA